MSHYTVKRVSSILDFLKTATKISDSWPCPEVWYRGCGNHKFPLLPGAYRDSDYDELQTFTEYQSIAVSYLASRPQDDWEWYYLMQHYGLPTRLLDWTESQLVAVYFAIYHWNESPREHPSVWMLDPEAVNAASYREREVTFPGGPFTQHWLCDAISGQDKPHKFSYEGGSYSNRHPIAIVPSRANSRIMAQQGTFTVHGHGRAPIEKLLVGPNNKNCLARIDLIGARKHDLLESLRVMGITHALLFPELASVGEAIRQRRRYLNATQDGVAKPTKNAPARPRKARPGKRAARKPIKKR